MWVTYFWIMVRDPQFTIARITNSVAKVLLDRRDEIAKGAKANQTVLRDNHWLQLVIYVEVPARDICDDPEKTFAAQFPFLIEHGQMRGIVPSQGSPSES